MHEPFNSQSRHAGSKYSIKMCTHPAIVEAERAGLPEYEPVIIECPTCGKPADEAEITHCLKCEVEICRRCEGRREIDLWGWLFCSDDCAIDYMTEIIADQDDELFDLRRSQAP